MSTPEPAGRTAHWEDVYRRKSADAVSWYRPHLDVSLELLARAGIGPASRVIDVGGGASTLVDDLLARGVRDPTVLDLSPAALAVARARLGQRANAVTWLTGDVRCAPLPAGHYTHWHDRAVLHFLTDAADVRAYAIQAARVLVAGGYAVIAGFAPDGPERCSGLPVARRSAAEIAVALGPAFTLLDERRECHRTPAGAEQSFSYALLRRS